MNDASAGGCDCFSTLLKHASLLHHVRSVSLNGSKWRFIILPCGTLQLSLVTRSDDHSQPTASLFVAIGTKLRELGRERKLLHNELKSLSGCLDEEKEDDETKLSSSRMKDIYSALETLEGNIDSLQAMAVVKAGVTTVKADVTMCHVLVDAPKLGIQGSVIWIPPTTLCRPKTSKSVTTMNVSLFGNRM